MRHTQQLPNGDVTVTMSTEEWLTFNNVRRELDALYSQYFLQGKRPGMLDAGKMWDRIMTAWGEWRRATGE